MSRFGVQMRAAAELALTSTYHPGNQVAGILRGHVAAALSLLRPARPSGSAIHGARQEIKRARAALRLLRESMEPDDFREEDADLRRAAQQLNDVRDCEVALRIFKRFDEPRTANLEPLRLLLAHERRSAVHAALQQPLATARALLVQVRQRTHDWSVTNDLELLAMALRRTYRKSRVCYRTARGSRADDDLHAWRRQVKYSAYQLEALGSLAPARMRKRLRRCMKLAKVLGRDHDLLLLRQRIPEANLDAASSARLIRAIGRERTDLQRRAFKLGQRLYRAKPRRFQALN